MLAILTMQIQEVNEIFVMGMYHSGTNALIQDLTRRINIPVYPDNGGGFHPDGHWKHSFHKGPSKVGQLVVFMIKDPLFWTQSLVKQYYEIKPLCDSYLPVNRLLGPISLCGENFNNVFSLWNRYLTALQDPQKFSPEKTLIIRYEDFLHDYDSTISRILQYVSPEKVIAGKLQPLTQSSKVHGYRCRNRQEAISYYQPHNRYRGFTLAQTAVMQNSLSADLLRKFGYPEISLSRRSVSLLQPNLITNSFTEQYSCITLQETEEGLPDDDNQTSIQALKSESLLGINTGKLSQGTKDERDWESFSGESVDSVGEESVDSVGEESVDSVGEESVDSVGGESVEGEDNNDSLKKLTSGSQVPNNELTLIKKKSESQNTYVRTISECMTPPNESTQQRHTHQDFIDIDVNDPTQSDTINEAKNVLAEVNIPNYTENYTKNRNTLQAHVDIHIERPQARSRVLTQQLNGPSPHHPVYRHAWPTPNRFTSPVRPQLTQGNRYNRRAIEDLLLLGGRIPFFK